MIIFDLEANGLLHDCTKIHCLALFNTEDGSSTVYNDEGNTEPIIRAVTQLEDCDQIAGHNIISYDLRVLKKSTVSSSRKVKS